MKKNIQIFGYGSLINDKTRQITLKKKLNLYLYYLMILNLLENGYV